LPQNRPVVIYTGALLEAKGLNNLFELVLEAKRRDIKCHFLIVGYPDEQARQFRENHGLEDFCTIVGRVPYESLGSYLGVASIAVEPKSTDSGEASGKLLNYMGAGLPVVCFDTENNRQILGECGYYGPAGDTGSLADHVASLVTAMGEGEKRGAMSRRRVMDKFSWDASADKIYAVYQTCLSG
jgi:glycosyltransferase involved in cell wall biosynthesis